MFRVMATMPDAEGGDRRSSGLQNWQAEAPVTGCQFIGHHLVSQDGRDRPDKESRTRKSRAERSRRSQWISAGNSTSTGTHIQLPHGVAVTSSMHQKAQNWHHLQARWGHLQGAFGDLCHLERIERGTKAKRWLWLEVWSYIGPGRRSLVTRQFPPPCFIARSKRHHCSHTNSLAKGPRPVEITPFLWRLSTWGHFAEEKSGCVWPLYLQVQHFLLTDACHHPHWMPGFTLTCYFLVCLYPNLQHSLFPIITCSSAP